MRSPSRDVRSEAPQRREISRRLRAAGATSFAKQAEELRSLSRFQKQERNKRAANVGQAAIGKEVAVNIADVSHGSVQTGAASTQVLQSAKSLSSESAHLRAAVEKFLDNAQLQQPSQRSAQPSHWRCSRAQNGQG